MTSSHSITGLKENMFISTDLSFKRHCHSFNICEVFKGGRGRNSPHPTPPRTKSQKNQHQQIIIIIINYRKKPTFRHHHDAIIKTNYKLCVV